MLTGSSVSSKERCSATYLWWWFYWIGLAAIFIAGCFLRFSLPSLPIMDVDTAGYLKPSVYLFATDTYFATWRNLFYPSFLALILWVNPHLDSIPYIQHILGIGTAALIVLIFFRSRIFLPSGQLLDWATRLIALIAAYLFLFSPSTIILEHSIRPEGLFPTACAVTILAGIEFSRRVFLEKQTDCVSAILGILLIFFAIGTYYLKPAWGLAMGTSLLPLAAAWLWISNQRNWKLKILLIGIFLASFSFVLPEYIFKKWKQRINKTVQFLPATLLCTHAEFIDNIIEKDALQLPPESEKRAYLLKFVQHIHSALLDPHHIRRYGLALNPDDIMYRGPLGELKKKLENDGIPFNQFCYYYYFRAWREHPYAMLKKVIKQMAFFYTPLKVHVYAIGTDFDLTQKYQRISQFLEVTNYANWQPLKDYQKNLHNLNLVDRKYVSLPYELQWTILLFNNTFLLVLLLALGGIAVVLLRKHSQFSKLRPAAFLLLYLASFNLANCLTISVVHMMNVTRYHFNQITISVVLQGFALLFLIALIQSYIQNQNKIAANT